MKHPSSYLHWYVNVPCVKHDFRSSGLSGFKCELDLGEIDLSTNYANGNPATVKQLAELYGVEAENVFVSSEGASGQNARIIRCIAERNPKKTEAIVEYPTYEPLLRQVQEHFKTVKRLNRPEKDAFELDANAFRKLVSKKTGLLAITNPHAPSGAISEAAELKEIMDVAREYDLYVLSDEIYAEFDRKIVPTLFSVDKHWGVVTTSFTKAYGLGGLKLGVALAGNKLVNELYTDVLNTVGNSPNIVQVIASELLLRHKKEMMSYSRKWTMLRKITEKWLDEHQYNYFPNRVGVTYWVKLPVTDSHRWINHCAIPNHSVAAVPGAFFLFRRGYELQRSNMIRLGLGNMSFDEHALLKALEILETAINKYENT